jgi:AcrR family transcriptional regulator
MADDKAGRPNQKRRTRKDLLQAAARLLKQGREPSLEEIAAEAMVSRATAYRYFPNVEALLIEAPLDVAMPDAETLFHNAPSGDAVSRLDQLDTVLHDIILANESSMRMMLAHSLKRGLQRAGDDTLPTRQNRRTPLIEAALEPAKKEFKPTDLPMLSKALALIIGTESMVVFKDVLQSNDAEARKVKRWAIRALVNAARKPVRGA